ncbi:MAG: tetratricopeptide repeat protein [Hyphomicrobiales bacterium]
MALVIGQSDYQHLSKLDNPGNDAKRVDELLTGLGFKADMVDSRSAKRLKRDIDDFIEDAEGADVAVIYYSGHGIEAGGENYLIPVDAQVTQDAIDADKLIKVGQILEELRGKVRIAILLLDACRTNPFPSGTMIRMAGIESPVPIGAGGLAAAKGVILVDQAEGPESLGEIIGFAAAPGQVALDGESGTNSPYAAAIVKHLAAKGLDFGQVMTLVSEEVYLATKGQQQPWTNAGLRRLLYFGASPEDEGTDEALIRGERRQLLLTIATTPVDLRRTVETIASADNVPLDGLYAMLRSLGVEAQKDPESLGKQLQMGAEKLKAFMAERETLKSSDVEIARLSSLADKAVAEGALNAAIAFHEKAKARVASLETTVQAAEADIKARRLEFAAVYAKSAKTRELAFDYLRAAQDWAKAYDQAKRWDDGKAFGYRMSQASSLVTHGDLKGDNAVLSSSIDLYTTILVIVSRERVPLDWALTQNNLGNALQTLGERESGTTRLEQAVRAYEMALEERTRERVPLDWATTQNNLGNALQTLGGRESGTARLEQAVRAYEAALEERTRARVPLDWATTQMNLGAALATLGERESGTARLEQAVKAYEAALEERTRERVPLDWATTQMNLGTALQRLGGRESGTARLEQAVRAYEMALEEMTRERVPLDWATTQMNLGTVLAILGERESGTARLEQAVRAYEAALEEMTRARVPLDWAMTQMNLGAALATLGERESGTARLEQAVKAYEAALEERTRERVPLDWATTQMNLGTALQRLGGRESGTARLEQAVRAYEMALEEMTRERVPLAWAMIQMNLGTALETLGERESGTARLEQAVKAYEAALEERTRERVPLDWAMTQMNLGIALWRLGERESGTARLEQAVKAYEAALEDDA